MQKSLAVGTPKREPAWMLWTGVVLLLILAPFAFLLFRRNRETTRAAGNTAARTSALRPRSIAGVENFAGNAMKSRNGIAGSR